MCRLLTSCSKLFPQAECLRLLPAILLSFSLSCPLFSQTAFSNSGQASTLLQYSESSNNDVWLLRYIPEFSLNQPLGNNALDVELAFNLYTTSRFNELDRVNDNAEADLYRFWLRYSASQFEARVGLQKISFGSSTLLRPLRWFDRVDPRDPLQITDGVYAALVRYYFLNNANIWVWGLIGNDDPKGWDTFSGQESVPEVGGRIQFPLAHFGELGTSYHFRKIDVEKTLGQTINQIEFNENENKFGADLRLDYLFGSWIEVAWVRQELELFPFPRQQFITIGADYMLPIGTGVQVIGEHMWISYGPKFFEHEETIPLSAALANYSYGLFDQFSIIVSREWDSGTTSRFLRWGRSYDRWQFFVNGFWNDEAEDQQEMNLLLNSSTNASGQLSGKGLQLLITFNH
ncbi:MAG: hypothetical protein ACRBF0_12160 [Calditrichia bacterium]